MTYLELGLAHSAIQSVLQRLIFEVEFNIILIWAITHSDIEIDLHSALWDRSQFVRLAELHVVPSSVII